MSSPLAVRPIGYVASARTDPADTTGWGEVEARLDAVDRTPVLDIKPVMPTLLPTDVTEPDWSRQLMADYYSG